MVSAVARLSRSKEIKKNSMWQLLITDRDGNERIEGPFNVEIALAFYAEYSPIYPVCFMENVETGESYF